MARPLLFRLQAESAHQISFRALETAYAAGLLPASRPLSGRATVVAGLTFPNPVGLAAGLDKNAEHLDALGSFGFGFIEVGTVTPRGQPGNPKPRMFRLVREEAVINRLGFNNLGLDTFLNNVQRSTWVRERRGVLGLNIGKNADTALDRAADDYLTCLEAVYPWADYVTINISSPNTRSLRQLQESQALDGLLQRLKTRQQTLARSHHKQVPLFLKIAPDLDDAQIDAIAHAVKTHEIEGVIATNTTLDRTQVMASPWAQETGGLSGRPVFEKSNHVIAQLRASLGRNTPIIGVGGIMSGADASAKINAGADLIQLYTGLIYRGPALVAEAVRATRSA